MWHDPNILSVDVVMSCHVSMKRTSVASVPPATVESRRRTRGGNRNPISTLHLLMKSILLIYPKEMETCSISSFGFADMSFFMHVCVAARDNIASFVTRATAIMTFFN